MRRMPIVLSTLAVAAFACLHRLGRTAGSSAVERRAPLPGDDLVAAYSIPEGKITVTPLAADPRFRPPPPEVIAAARAKYKLPERYVLSLASNKPHKNLVRLIEAFAALRKGEFRDLKLIIIGDEISKLPTLRWAVHSYKLHKHVRFLGFLPPFRDSVKAGQMVVVKFAVGGSSGAPITDDLAQTLASSCAVRATVADAADCATYDPIADAFLAQLRTSRTVAPGAYNVVVNVTVGGTLVATGSRSIQITDH